MSALLEGVRPLVAAGLLALWPLGVVADESGVAVAPGAKEAPHQERATLESRASHGPSRTMEVDLSNMASLQRGAGAFANYCAGCHRAEFMRYGRVAQDLRMTDELVLANLAPPGAKAGDTMMTAMDPEDGARWFGVAPPDLSLVARARGADWLYSYLHGFYRDPERPWGVNNLVFEDVSMPHVLVPLQGVQSATAHGLETVTEGSMDAEAYDQLVRDLVNYLVYVGEPAKMQRYALGAKVVFFLLLFTTVAWFLKREFWKDVH